MRKAKSLKDLLLIHELAFILLVMLAVAAGGIGIKYQADEDSLDYLQNELARALASR